VTFDGVAPHYAWLEPVLAANLLQQCRLAFLGEVRDARRVLLLGEGPGRFLVPVLRETPGAHVTVVDSSRRMVDLARHRLRRHGLATARVTFLHQDACTWAGADTAFDLVASHFFLDCFRPDQLATLVPRVAAVTRPGGRWLLADFREPRRGWRRARARGVLALAYLFFGLITGLPARRLTDPDPYLQAAGFSLRHRVIRNFGLLHSDVWIRTGDPVPARALARASAT